MRKGVGEGRTGRWGYRGIINNKDLLQSIRKYINYPVINHTKKNKKKNIYFCMCIMVPHCCAAELNATLKISHTSIKFLEKKECPQFSYLPVSFLLHPAPCFLFRECWFSSCIPTICTLLKKKNKTLFCIGVQLINNILSFRWTVNRLNHIYPCILVTKIPLPSRLSYN